MISDLELRRNVLDELEFEPSVNAVHIGIVANKGIVNLSGCVMSYAEKLAAENIARRVKGAKAIAEEIEVRLPSDRKHADNEIAARAVNILKWQVGLPADRIAVKVERGVVTLTGRRRVALSEDRRRAYRAQTHRRRRYRQSDSDPGGGANLPGQGEV